MVTLQQGDEAMCPSSAHAALQDCPNSPGSRTKSSLQLQGLLALSTQSSRSGGWIKQVYQGHSVDYQSF